MATMIIKANEFRFYPIFDGKIKDEIVMGNDKGFYIEQDIKIVNLGFVNKVESDYKIEWLEEKPSNCEQYALALYIGKHKMCFVPLVTKEKLGGKYISIGKHKGWFPMILCNRKQLSKLLSQYEWIN